MSRCRAERSRTIEITEFIDLKEVDPVYYDHPYYLLPSNGGEKAYRLLAEAMHRTNKAGIAKFVLAEREYFVVVKCTEGALELITLHYSSEVRPDTDRVPKQDVIGAADDESRAKKNIKKMIQEFDPGKYADNRRKGIMDLLMKKAKERPPVEAPVTAEDEGEGPADLVASMPGNKPSEIIQLFYNEFACQQAHLRQCFFVCDNLALPKFSKSPRKGTDGFSGVTAGRAPSFRDLSVGETAAPPQAENAEGAKHPPGISRRKDQPGRPGTKEKASPPCGFSQTSNCHEQKK